MLIVFRMNETQHVRMRDPHHAHIGAAAYAALLHYVSHLIDDVHERHGTGSNTACGSDESTRRSEEFISHPGAAASLMNRRRSLGVIHDSGYRVRHIQHKACSELTICFACVNEARR